MPEVPKGYTIINTPLLGDVLKKDGGSDDPYDTSEFFRLTGRKFEDIDHYLGYLPSQMIEYLLHKNWRINIADFGGGRDSVTIDAIKERYGRRVKALNVDLLPNKPTHLITARRVQADITRLPLADNSIHLGLSFQVLPHMETDAKALDALKEIGRVLVPGGVAFIDDNNMISGNPDFSNVFELEDTMGCILTTRLGNNARPEEVHFGEPSRFLMVQKQPQDRGMVGIRERSVHHH